MRLLPHEIALGFLAGDLDELGIPNPHTAFDGREEALRFLKGLTGEDFGLNVEKWRAWFAACDSDTLRLLYKSLNSNTDPLAQRRQV